MNRVPAIMFAAVCCFCCPALFGQSSSVRLGVSVSAVRVPSATHSVRVSGRSENVSNSMPPSWKRWESILNQPFPDRFKGQRKCEDVLVELRQLGLPILLDQSAVDDSLSKDEPIELKLPRQSLGARLTQALYERQACMVFREGRILIISLDDAGDIRFLMTVTYDVSDMGLNPSQLIDVIQGTIEPDDWTNTGQGLGTIEYLSVRGRDLLVISASYRIHRSIRKLFDGMDELTGTRKVRNYYTWPGVRGPSQTQGSAPVVVPRGTVFPQVGNRNSGGFFNVIN